MNAYDKDKRHFGYQPASYGEIMEMRLERQELLSMLAEIRQRHKELLRQRDKIYPYRPVKRSELFAQQSMHRACTNRHSTDDAADMSPAVRDCSSC